MSEILIYYALGILLCVFSFFGIKFCLSKWMKTKIRWQNFVVGLLLSVLYFAIALVLIFVTFNNNYYYNTAFFRTMVGGLYFVLLALVRFIVTKKFFYDQKKISSGISFSFGFGFGPVLFLGIYLLMMFLIVGINGLFNSPHTLDAEGFLTFADNTIISVFQPAAGHLSFAFVFVGFNAFAVTFSAFIKRITSRHYHFGAVLGWLVLFLMLEAVALMPIPFVMQFNFKHWQLAVIEWLCVALAIILARFIPGGEHEPDPDYQKQFE